MFSIFLKVLILYIVDSYALVINILNINNGSLEAIIRYDFGISKENVQQNFDNPRYFF